MIQTVNFIISINNEMLGKIKSPR